MQLLFYCRLWLLQLLLRLRQEVQVLLVGKVTLMFGVVKDCIFLHSKKTQLLVKLMVIKLQVIRLSLIRLVLLPVTMKP